MAESYFSDSVTLLLVIGEIKHEPGSSLGLRLVLVQVESYLAFNGEWKGFVRWVGDKGFQGQYSLG